MPVNASVLLDQVYRAALWFLGSLLSLFAQLARPVGDHLGVPGELGLYLLMALFGLWVLYQLLRILTLIVLKILLPLAAILAALFLLAILAS